MPVPTLTLNSGVQIPQLGYGVFQIEPAETEASVLAALEVGYRHIDGAQGYRNEKEVGDAVERSGIDPADIFLTSKLGNAHLTYDDARRAIDLTLTELRVKKPDLFLLHWPMPTVRDFMLVWRSIEDAFDDGAFRAIGVSNFHIPHLERLSAEARLAPTVNQIELHPHLSQRPIRDYDDAHGIVTEAWSPLGQGLLVKDETIGRIAADIGRTPAQVVLRWHIQSGIVVFPKSTNPARMRENFEIFDFVLTDEQMATIDALNRDERTGMDPDTFRYRF